MNALFLLALLACGGAEAPDAPADGADAPVEAPVDAPADEAPADEAPSEAWEAPTLDEGMDMCLGDIDCVAVELGCCDHCNGGAVVAVNKTRAEEAKEKFAQKDCGNPCTELACADVEVECKMGCKIKE